MEEWRPVRGLDRYEVSNLGRVRVLDLVTRGRSGVIYTRPGRVLKPVLDDKGYPRVQLTSAPYKAKWYGVHQLVAKHFVAPFDGPEVAHRDHNPLNAAADNLEWKTHRENMLASVEIGIFHAAINPRRAKRTKARI